MKKFTILFLLILGTANLIQAQWSADIRLTNNAAASFLGKKNCLAASGDSLHVVWVDNRDGNSEIYYKCSIDGGLSWGADTRLTFIDSLADRPVIAISGSNLHIVWTSCRDGNNEIYYKQSTNGGLTWGADVRMTNDPGFSSYADIAVSGSVIHVLWNDNRTGVYKVYYKRSTDGGLSWGSEVGQTNETTSYSNPASIALSGSDVHIVWSDYRDGNLEIYYKRSNDAGSTWGSATRLTNNTGSSNLPRIVVSASVVHVAWFDNRDGNYEIYNKRSTDGGLTWGADTRLTNAAGDSKNITLTVTGLIVHVAWQDNRNGNEEIFYKNSKNGGLSWNSDTLLVDNNATMSECPSLALSGSVVHIIWSDKRDGPNGEIYYKRNPTGNSIGIEDLNIAKNGVDVYPNPSNGKFVIEIKDTKIIAGNLDIEIFNAIGERVLVRLDLKIQDYNEIDLSKQPKGIYFVKIYNGKKIYAEKIVVQ